MASDWIYSDIKLSIGILVSNRIGTIRRCLDSLVPILQAVPSELIALDTVGEGSDGSADVAREYTDKVYRYEWCQDFAHARNACLSYAKGEWFLFLDDDEWFEDVEDLIRFFKNGEAESHRFGIFYVKNYVKGGSVISTIANRMIRRRTDTHFVGRIHECFNEAFPPIKQFESYIYHDGYLFTDPEKEKAHTERNVVLLKKELQENEWKPNPCAQLVQELLFSMDTAKEGYDLCWEYVEYFAKKGMIEHSCVQWMLVAICRYHLVLGQYEEVFNQSQQFKEKYPFSEVAELALMSTCVEAAAKSNCLEKIVLYAKRFAELKQWTEKHPEETMYQMQLDFPKQTDDLVYAEIVQAGAAAANYLEQYEQAYEFWRVLPWKTKDLQSIRFQKNLLVTLRALKDKTPLITYYRTFYNEEMFLPEHRKYLPKECQDALKEAGL